MEARHGEAKRFEQVARRTRESNPTLIAVIEIVSGKLVGRRPYPWSRARAPEKTDPDPDALLMPFRWRDEATELGMRLLGLRSPLRPGAMVSGWRAGCGPVDRSLRHSSDEHSGLARAAAGEDDRLDTGLLKRAFLGWLRGEEEHCSMAAVPTLEEEDAKRPNREREHWSAERTQRHQSDEGSLRASRHPRLQPQIAQCARTSCDAAHARRSLPSRPTHWPSYSAKWRISVSLTSRSSRLKAARLERLEQAPQEGSNAKVLQLERISGVGVETADMLVHEVFSRNFRDQRAVARYAGLTGSPDESGRRRREKGLAKAGNARVRRGMIQLAWRFLIFQKDSGLRSGTKPALMAARSRRPWLWRWLASCSSLFGDLSQLAMYPRAVFSVQRHDSLDQKE